MKKYDVYLEDRIVGAVELSRSDLYYEVKCRCDLASGIYRLIDNCDAGCVSIGICILDHKSLMLQRMVPVKKLGFGGHNFYLTPTIIDSERCEELVEDAPFNGVSQLRKAQFIMKDGIPHVRFGV